MPTRPDPRPEIPRIAVAGGGSCDEATRQCALEVGRRIAEAGAVLVCGGGSGVMAAAAEGARRAGGTTIGILPGTGRLDSPPNRSIDIPIYTGLGQGRNLVLVLTADAVIAVGGEWGTLSEIALAGKHGRPVVLLGSWGLEPPPPGADGGQRPAITMPVVAGTPREAVEAALERTRPRGRVERNESDEP